MFFFCKQKTAYEMRISDWSSDVCSSDLSSPTLSPDGRLLVLAKRVVDFDANKASSSLWIENLLARDAAPPVRLTPEDWNVNSPAFGPDGKTVYFLSGKRSEERRVGKECVSPCRSRWSPCH